MYQLVYKRCKLLSHGLYNTMFNSFSLRKRLIMSFLATIIISALIIAGVLSSRATAIITEKVRQTHGLAIYQVRNNIDTILSNYEDIVLSIYKDRMMQRYIQGKQTNAYTREQFNEVLAGRMFEGVSSIYIFSDTGRIHGYDTQALNVNINLRQLDEYRQSVLDPNEISWLPTRRLKFYSPAAQNIPEISTAFSATVVLRDFDSLDEIGFLMVNFREQILREAYEKLVLQQGSYGLIIDQQGYIVSHNNSSYVGTRLDYQNMQNILYTKNNDNGVYIDHLGESHLVISETSMVTGWKLVNFIPMQAITMEVEGIRQFSMILMVLSVIFAFGIAMLLSGSVLNPLAELTKAMKKVGEGDFSVRVTPRRQDEIGEFGMNFNKMITEINTLISKVYQAEIVKKELEYKALQAQINPHFLYNTLDSINWIAKRNNINEISTMVIALGDLMRISINKDKDFITIGEEMKYIEDYLTIQKIRYRDKFSVDINVEPEILNKRIPKLVVQPVVENAIVHGIEKKIEKGILVIYGSINNGFLYFKVIDDGIGMIDTELRCLQNKLNATSSETTDTIDNANGIKQANISDSSSYLKGHTGMGIINVNSRIKMLYGHQYGLSIDSKKDFGTEVTITMPALT